MLRLQDRRPDHGAAHQRRRVEEIDHQVRVGLQQQQGDHHHREREGDQVNALSVPRQPRPKMSPMTATPAGALP